MKRIQHGRQTRRILLSGTTARARRGLAMTGLLGLGVVPALFTGGSAAATAPVGQGFNVTASDLSHILRQIKIAEAHVATLPAVLAGPDGQLVDDPSTAANEAADNGGMCDGLVGPGPDQIATPLVADGLRTVDGSCNNLIHGQEKFGAEGQLFPRLTSAVFKNADNVPPGFGPPGGPPVPTSYTQTSGLVFDSQPRLISNLIVDQTSTNPSAVSAAGHPVRTQGNAGVFSCVARNEVQTLSGTPTGDFQLEFEGMTTTSLSPTATAADVRAALVALDNVGPADVSVSGGPLPAAITIKFVGGLKAKNVAQLIDPAVTGLVVDTATQGDSGDAGCVPEHETLFIPNVTTDVGLSPPFNSMFTIFGQFFDHGVDQTVKGGSGTVFVPLQDDDPLIAGPDHILNDDPDTEADEALDNLPANQRFMVLSRATNQPGPDHILGTADDIRDATNTDSPFVDQSQTYTSHASHQVYLREYVLTGAVPDQRPVATGKLIHSADGGMGTWALVKQQAAEKLGLKLRDQDALDIPMVAADLYGNFIKGPHGLPQYVTVVDGQEVLVEGNLANPVEPPVGVKHFNIPFLTDIAHSAVPTPGLLPDSNITAGKQLDVTIPAGSYDNELLDLHFIAGDGRVNENIALTAVHQIFHSEHDRLVDDMKHTLIGTGDVNVLNQWLVTPLAAVPTTQVAIDALIDDLAAWRGERLFQAARFVTEMEYQHLVFEEFARKVQPLINPFAGFAFTQTNINPAVKAEFAHAVYRFGHSMLTETIARRNENTPANQDDNDIKLLDGFLNPASYTDGGAAGALSSQQAAGSIFMGMSDQTGNEIDEFVTDTLRNNLLGLPLDLPTINMTRARSEGIPPLNELRRQIYASTNDSQLKPYTNWIDFGLNLKHPESLINFVAAYGRHPSIANVTEIAAKREAARVIVDPSATDTPPADAGEFLNSIGAWASTETGLNEVDLWVGGLAERTNLFGGLLGSTFNYVFESQLTDLQNSDRLYYLGRTPGMNLRAQLEGNSFAELVMRNTTAHSLKADAFGTADCKFELTNLPPADAPFTTNILADDPTSECDEHALLIRMADGTIAYRTTNTVDPAGINGQSVYNGTAGVDRIRGGVDNDTFLGNEGNDIIEGRDGADVALGGEGNDRITDDAGDDVLKGGPGNDAIEAGPGLDIIMGGTGKDFMNGGANINAIFAGDGDDFLILGQGEDAGQGDGGDDWMEGGDQPDLLQGDSGGLFFDDRNQPGNDVFIGQAGDDDYDAEGGDDIMVTGPGIEKSAGAAGYDWSTGFSDPLPQVADLALRILPADNIVAVDVRDRFNETEGLSGGPLNDNLKGDSIVPADAGAGAGVLGCDALDQHSLDRIAGLDALVPPLTTPSGPIITNSQTNNCPLEGDVWGEGNILLGGGGSDVLEGRGANDIIDGDKYLSVRLSVRDHALPAVEIGSADLMESRYLRDANGALTGPTLQDAVMAGTVDPGDIVAVREILPTSPGTAVDTAVFSDVLANYTITPNADDSTTVSHLAGAGADGTDILWNIERLQFADGVIDLTGSVVPGNTAATGAPAIAGTPTAGSALTVTNGTIADADGIASVSFVWQAEVTPGNFAQVGTGATFTPGPSQVGQRLRVVAAVLDNQSASTSLPSDLTAPVAAAPIVAGNSLPTGTPIVTDAVVGGALAGRPRVNDPLGTDTLGIVDVDGLVGVTFFFQWQQSTNGTTWTDIAGATGRTFTPTVVQLGDLLRVRVAFTDQGGSLETLDSAPTRDVRPARGRGGRPPVLVLNALAVPRTVTVSLVARRGLPVSFTAPASTTVVRVMVFRVGSKRPLATQFIRVKLGKTSVKLRTAAMRRALHLRGRYRIEVTPGRSRAAFGKATVRLLTVRR